MHLGENNSLIFYMPKLMIWQVAVLKFNLIQQSLEVLLNLILFFGYDG